MSRLSMAKAQGLVFRAFDGMVDKNGEPYSKHCLTVAQDAFSRTDDEELYCVGLLHDVVEDTDVVFSDLVELGLSDRVVEAVESMTRREGEAYTDYIRRLSENPDAVVVKLCDLRHNTDPQRFSAEKLGHETYDRLRKKYFWAVDYLESL